MSNLFLAIPKLDASWIDLSVGEAHIVRDALFNTLDLNRSQNKPMIDLHTFNKCEYQPPTGYQPLVKFLENKYQAPIVITNGAKNALGAVFYALHKMNKPILGMRKVNWALIPPLVQTHNLIPN